MLKQVEKLLAAHPLKAQRPPAEHYNPSGRTFSPRYLQVLNRLRRDYQEKVRQDSDANPLDELDDFVCEEFNCAQVSYHLLFASNHKSDTL